MYFDTHAHYDDERFSEDRHEILQSLQREGVSLVVNPGCDVVSTKYAIELAESYPFVYAAAGIHPENCGGCSPEDFAAIFNLCAHDKVVAIGEIGLDYYWDENPPRDFQKEVFRTQLKMACDLNLPVIIHDRDAHADCLSIVSEFPGLNGVFHCFSGSAEMAEILLKRGWYLGFDGPVTYKNAKKAIEVLELCPLDRLLLETDSPYLSPVPRRGERNDSRNLRYIAEKIAEIKNCKPEEVARAGYENGKRLFQIP